MAHPPIVFSSHKIIAGRLPFPTDKRKKERARIGFYSARVKSNCLFSKFALAT